MVCLIPSQSVSSAGTPCITEINRICLVLFGMNNRIFGPESAAIDELKDEAEKLAEA
jgi:hypothetical protein